MKKQFVYVYFMRIGSKISQAVPSHITYWKNNNIEGYTGGPFADRSGGLIIFRSESLGNARQIVNKDPFILENLIANNWLKEWTGE